jgi:hypothetical protein
MCLFLTRVFHTNKIVKSKQLVACETTYGMPKNTVLRDMTSCCPVYVHGVFRGMCCLHLQGRRVSKARGKHNAELCLVNNACSRSSPGVGGSSTEWCRRRITTTRLEGVVMSLKIWKTFECWVMATSLKKGRASAIREDLWLASSSADLRLEWTGKRLARVSAGFCVRISR